MHYRVNRTNSEGGVRKREGKIFSLLGPVLLTAVLSIIGTIYILKYQKPKIEAYFDYAFFTIHVKNALEDAKKTNPFVGVRAGLLETFLKPGAITLPGDEVEKIEIQDSGMLKILLKNVGRSTATDIRLGIVFPDKPLKPEDGILRVSVTPNVQAVIPEGLTVSRGQKPSAAAEKLGVLEMPSDIITLKQLPPNSIAVLSVHWTFPHQENVSKVGWDYSPRAKLLFITSKEVVGEIKGQKPIEEIFNEEKNFTGEFATWIDNIIVKTKKGGVSNIEIPMNIRNIGKRLREVPAHQ